MSYIVLTLTKLAILANLFATPVRDWRTVNYDHAQGCDACIEACEDATGQDVDECYDACVDVGACD